MSQKGRPKNLEIDKKIMNAVEISLQENDIKDFSMEMVIKEAKIAKQTLYNRFSSKLELLLAYLNFIALEKVTIESSNSSIEKIESIMFPAIDYAKSKESVLLKLIAMEALKDEKSTNLVREVFIEKRRKLLIETIDEGKDRGEIKSTMDSSTLCDMLFGSIWYRMIFNIDKAQVDKKSISAILRSL